MKIADTIRRSNRSLLSAKARTILTALAISVGTFALTLTLAASNGANKFVSKVIQENFDPAELIVTADAEILGKTDTTKPKEYDPSFGSITTNGGTASQVKRITDEDLKKIKNIEGVESIREGVSTNLLYVTREGHKKYAGTVGVFSAYQKPALLAGDIPTPLNGSKIIIPEGFLSSFGFSDAKDAIGKNIKLVVRKPVNPNAIKDALSQGAPINQQSIQQLTETGVVEEEFVVTAVMKKPTTSQPGTELYMYIGIDDAKRLDDISTTGTDNYHKYSYIFVRASGGTDKAKLTATQDRIKNMGYQAQSVEDTQKFLTQIISVLQGIVVTFGLIAVVASVFGVVNTMYISVLQRTREIGLMKALGMRKKDVGRLFRFEAAWIGFIGGVLGAALAFIVGAALNPVITKQLDLGSDKLLIFDLKQIVGLIIALMVIATLAGLLPARKAAKLDPIEALRTE